MYIIMLFPRSRSLWVLWFLNNAVVWFVCVCATEGASSELALQCLRSQAFIWMKKLVFGQHRIKWGLIPVVLVLVGVAFLWVMSCCHGYSFSALFPGCRFHTVGFLRLLCHVNTSAMLCTWLQENALIRHQLSGLNVQLNSSSKYLR